MLSASMPTNSTKARLASQSYVHNFGKEPLKYITIAEALDQSVDKFGHRECIVSISQNRRWTFRQMQEQSNRLAAALIDIGLERGDRLGIWCPSMVEWFVTTIACCRTGIMLVALNPSYQAPEIEYCINKVGIKGIICQHGTNSDNYIGILKTVAPEINQSEPGHLQSKRVPSLKHIIVISDTTMRGLYNFEELLTRENENCISAVIKNRGAICPDDPCLILFSSGTTGKSKASTLSQFAIINNAYLTGIRNQFDTKQHKMCTCVPFFHIFGIIAMVTTVVHGSTLVIPSMSYSPTKSLEVISAERCTTLYGTTTMYVDLIKLQSELKLDISVDSAICGGSNVPPKMISDIREVLKVGRVVIVFGLTETSGALFQSPPIQDDEDSYNTVGYASDHIEMKIVDHNNRIVPTGTPGELHVRGYLTMLGYWSGEGYTREEIGTDGWLRTGDQFILQENGFGKIVGRLKEMINRGGEKIFPKEVEEVLNTHPDILEAQVIGLPHDRLGEVVCACVREKNGSHLTLENVRIFCSDKMAKQKVPSVLKIVETFPTTITGKVQKYKLAKCYIN